MADSRERLLSLGSLSEQARQQLCRQSETLEVLTTGDMPFASPAQFIDNPILYKGKKLRKKKKKKKDGREDIADPAH